MVARTPVVAPWTAVDPLGEVLHALRMSGVFYCRSELTAPWALGMPGFDDCLYFHLVTSGSCWLEIEDGPSAQLRAGDFVLVPHGRGHRLSDEPGMSSAPRVDLLPQQQLGEHYWLLRHGGGGPVTTMICGVIAFEDATARHLVRMLPPVISVDGGDPRHAAGMARALDLMVGEVRELSPGGESVISRLADILVIQSIRAWLQTDGGAQDGWLGALRDARVGHALAAFHREPGAPWTLAALAREASMSRSAFAARFARLVGEPPMHYVTRWRMNLALTWLREGESTVAEVALRLGYASEAGFSRAFKGTIGMSPGAAGRSAPGGVRGRGGAGRVGVASSRSRGSHPVVSR